MEDAKQFRLSETSGPKLTSWSKEPDIRDLKKDLEAAKPSHDAQVAKIDHWMDLLHVRGKCKPERIPGRSNVEPKLIRRQAEWRYSALTEPFLSSQKLFKITPTTFEDDTAASQNELVINWQFRTKLNRVKLIDDVVRAVVNKGTGIARVGWKRQTATVMETVPEYALRMPSTEEELQALMQAIELQQADPRGFEALDPALKEAVAYYNETQQPSVAEQIGTKQVPVEKILENRPTVELKHPRNIFVDPSCQGDLDKALFVVESFETNKADLLKEGKKYKNLDRVNWGGNSPLMEPDHETKTPNEFQFSDEMRRRVVAHEYWGSYDINDDGTLVPIVVTWIGDTIIRIEENPYPDGKVPYVFIPYMPIEGEVYGEPDAELLEDNQKILGALSRGMIDLLGKSANSQQGMAKGMLDALNKRRFDNGEDYEFNPAIHPSQGLIEHKYPELPQSALLMLQHHNNEAEALTGVKSFSGGMSGQAYGDVAAGIRGMLDAASKREMAILRRIAKGMTDIAVKIIAMNSEFLSEKEVVRVTNEQFVVVNREDLKGNFDLETDISTVEVDNAKAQDLGFMLQTIGPNAPPQMAFKIMGEIMELKRMPVFAKELKEWKPEPDPMQQQLQQLELQKLQMEIGEIESRIQLNQAKAQQALAMKDKADLEFVEQETGTNHARNMETIQAQARANQDLEVTKAIAKPVKIGEKKPDVEAAIGFNQASDNIQRVGNSLAQPVPTPLLS